MLSPRQTSALNGVGLLYKFDPRAWDFFDKTPNGFWSAYIVAVAVAPLHFAHRILDFDADDPSLTFAPYLIVQGLAYVFNWALFPFVMIYISRLLGRTNRFLSHMVPWVWMQLPLYVVLLASQILGDMGLLPQAVLEIVDPMVLIAYAVYGTYVAALGLQVQTATAFGVVVLDFVLSGLAGEIIARI
jgi:hypothetical protein